LFARRFRRTSPFYPSSAVVSAERRRFNRCSLVVSAERRWFNRCLLVVSAERRRFTRRPPSFPPNAFVFRRILPSESILSTGKTLAASSPS